MFRRILVSSLLLALPAVAAADVRVDVDRHKDFAKSRTFTVEIGPLVRTDGVVDEQNTLAETRFGQAVTGNSRSAASNPTTRQPTSSSAYPGAIPNEHRSSAPVGTATAGIGRRGEDTGDAAMDTGATRTSATCGPTATSKGRSSWTSSSETPARWSIAPESLMKSIRTLTSRSPRPWTGRSRSSRCVR